MSESCGVMQQLRCYLDCNPEFKKEFEESLANAIATGVPQFGEWGIKNLTDYLDYCESFLKWVPTENKDGSSVYNHICVFYLVLDKPPISCRQSPIDPSTHCPYTFLSQWIIDYAKEMGKFMDSPESISEEAIDTFYQAPSYHMQDYDRVPWKTFNEFFARKIKPEVRPIDAPGDDTVIVSPADAKFDGWWPVDDSANCHFDNGGVFNVKGVPWSISQLLSDECNNVIDEYWPRFAGGKFCHSFLGPNDYHRQHAPVSGKVLEARVISGLCYLEVTVVDEPEDGKRGTPRPRLVMRRKLDPVVAEPTKGDPGADAPNTAGYQFIQARALVLIDNPTLGLVAVLPIGMAQVSSVVLSVKEGDYVEKGQEISYFQLGGSDIVMVFQPQANVEFTVEKYDREYEPVDAGRGSAEKPEPGWLRFGQQIAKASPLQ